MMPSKKWVRSPSGYIPQSSPLSVDGAIMAPTERHGWELMIKAAIREIGLSWIR